MDDVVFSECRISTTTCIGSAYHEIIKDETKIEIFELAKRLYVQPNITYIKFKDNFVFPLTTKYDKIYSKNYSIPNPWYNIGDKSKFGDETYLYVYDDFSVDRPTIGRIPEFKIKIKYFIKEKIVFLEFQKGIKNSEKGKKGKKKKKKKTNNPRKRNDFKNSFTIEIKISQNISRNCKIYTNGRLQVTGCKSNNEINDVFNHIGKTFKIIQCKNIKEINEMISVKEYPDDMLVPKHILRLASNGNTPKLSDPVTLLDAKKFDKHLYKDIIKTLKNKIIRNKSIFTHRIQSHLTYIALQMCHFGIIKPTGIRLNQCKMYKFIKAMNNDKIFIVYENLMDKTLKMDLSLDDGGIITYLIFSSGKINMTNIKSYDQRIKGYNFITDFIKKNIKSFIMTSRLTNAIDLVRNAGNVVQKSQKWLQLRVQVITASEVQAIILEKPLFKTYESYIMSKAEERCGLRRFHGNKYTRFGECFEPISRYIYMYRINHEVNRKYKCLIYDTGFYIHPINKYIGASPDGVIMKFKVDYLKSCNKLISIQELEAAKNSKNLVDACLIEIKCPSKYKRTKDIKKDKPNYYCQIQQQLYVTGLKYCVFLNNDFKIINEEEFVNGIDNPNGSPYRGVLIKLTMEDKSEQYIYPPSIITNKSNLDKTLDYLDKKSTTHKNDPNIVKSEYVFWRLDDFEAIEVDYDKQWYESHLKFIKLAQQKIDQKEKEIEDDIIVEFDDPEYEE
jgi:TATA-box binding protein (TBP) (component of TFIID and TFIIIB)